MSYNLSSSAVKVSQYILAYKELLQGKTAKKYNEKYKWQNVKVFQDHWDIDAANFSQMIETSFTPSSNLWVGQNYYPVGMLRLFSEMNQGRVKEIFYYLFNESIGLLERITNTEKYFDELLAEYNSKTNKNLKSHYVEDRFISLLLYFKYPDKYYLYKYSMFAKFCKLFSQPIPKRGGDENMINYFELCDTVRDILLQDAELIEISKSLLDDTCYDDKSLHLLTQDFVYACSTYLAEDSGEDSDELNLSVLESQTLSDAGSQYYKSDGIHYWLLSPGTGASKWEDFYNQGIAAIGWEEMGDLMTYPNRESMAEALRKKHPDNKNNNRHNTLALWNFSRDIKIGDIIIAKKGTTEYIGYGIVTGDYEFNQSGGSFPNQRKVEWIKKGTWPETEGPIVTKILTDITKYPVYIARLNKLLGIYEDTEEKININYWWLNANPKYWKITNFEIGQEQSYTTFNEKGNKRRVYEYFKAVKPGDMIVGYESAPVMKAVAIMEVTNGIHIDEDDGQEKISFVIRQFLSTPASWSDLSALKELENCDVLKNNQGSLFKLRPTEFNTIVKLSSVSEVSLFEPYDMEIAQNEVFMGEQELDRILRILEKKKNILLQGPPGVGKTFLAKRLAYLWMENKDYDKIEMVQFHQSYSYEDFMQGYRPTEDGHFKLLNGVFYRFCKKAMRNPNEDYFFIIDEINRGNLSKIFGELMMLMESDKRGETFSIPLIYSQDSISHFHIPKNLYIIGTMNTADRSLAIVDYALRRRFAFIQLKPSFDKLFIRFIENLKIPANIINRIVDRITYLNNTISNDRNLGDGFLIGHSYFCNPPLAEDFENWYKDTIEFEIAPILREYWFDDQVKAEDQIQRLY